MDPGVLMRRLLHGLFALVVLLGTWAAPQTVAPTQAEACGCCEVGTPCGCGMPSTPRAPRCPNGQAQAPPLVAAESRLAPQAESASCAEAAPWQGLGEFDGIGPLAATHLFHELPRPPDRLLQRLALLSTFRN